MSPLQRVLLAAGVALIAIAFAWPWLSRLPFGRLPGDLVIERPGLRVYVPFASMLLVSLLGSFLLWLLRR